MNVTHAGRGVPLAVETGMACTDGTLGSSIEVSGAASVKEADELADRR